MSAEGPTIPSQVIDEGVEISTGIEETSDGFRVTRTAAFAEMADRPKKTALDGERTKNDVQFYDDMVKFDAELAGTIHAQSQSAASGIGVTHPAVSALDDNRSDIEKEITKDCGRLISELNIDRDGATIFHNLITHGNDVSFIQYSSDDGVIGMDALPLRSLTIVDQETLDAEHRFNRGTEDAFSETITEPTWYVLNEGREAYEQIIPQSDVLHVAVNRRGNWHKDLKRRWTFGVWGERRLEPIKYSLQAKQNTLANKVAMDDKLLAREYFYINVEDLFGHITDPDDRLDEARAYAQELREMIQDLDADQKPILPEEVTVEVEGPDGDTARNMSNFIQTMNDSLQHALNYHVGGFGRDAGGTDRANKPAKEMSDNSVRHLRKVMKTGFRRLFEIHTILKYPEARVVVDPTADGIERYGLREDIRLPVLTFDPVDPQDQVEKIRNAISGYEKGVYSLNEARVEAGAEPVEQDDIKEMYWYKNPVSWSDDKSEDALYKNQDPQKETEEPADSDSGGDGDATGNRRSYPTDSSEDEL